MSRKCTVVFDTISNRGIKRTYVGEGSDDNDAVKDAIQQCYADHGFEGADRCTSYNKLDCYTVTDDGPSGSDPVPGGDLYWYKHDGWQTGDSRWQGRKQVGNSWQIYNTVFASSDGIVYGIDGSGDLYWYKHDGWQTGDSRWQGRKQVGNSWQIYNIAFASSDGIVYGITI
jgi:hypothetical protein